MFRWPLRNLPVPAQLIDQKERVLEVSDRWLEMTGYARDEVIGRQASSFLSPQSARYAALEVIPSLRFMGRADHAVLLVTCRDGEVVPVRCTARVEQNGDVLRVFAVMLPETDRRAELEDYSFAANHWFWEMDADLRFVWVSQSIAKTVGRPVEWFCGRTRDDLGEPDVDAATWAAHRAALAHREPFRNFTYRMHGPDGPVWVRTSGRPIFAPDGSFLGYRGAGADVTEEVEMRRAAEAAASRLALALDAAEDIYALWDADDRLVICNARFRATCGLGPEQLPAGATFEDFIRACIAAGRLPTARGREADWIERRLRLHREPGAPFEIELDDGRWLLIREQRAASGETVLIGADITSLKRQQQGMRQALEAAEEANASRAAFLAQMSHELRTPMNAILGFAEVLETELHGPLGDPRYVEYVEHIHDSGRQLLDLINDLLDISKIEAGDFRMRDEPLDMVPLVVEAVELMAPIAERKQVNLHARPCGGARVRADRRAVRQILMNLLSNGIKFTGAGGTVRIEMATAADGLSLTVADSGHGIPANQVALVWQPFALVEDRLLTRPMLGSGLGLSVVRALMEMHQGTADLESEVGIGTRVTVRFPAERVLPPGA